MLAVAVFVFLSILDVIDVAKVSRARAIPASSAPNTHRSRSEIGTHLLYLSPKNHHHYSIISQQLKYTSLGKTIADASNGSFLLYSRATYSFYRHSTMAKTKSDSLNITDQRSGIQALLNSLDQIDEFLSQPIFRLALPKWVEFVFSIPANCFGTTACLTIGPLWVALAAISQQDYSHGERRILMLRIIAYLMTTIHIVAWYLFNNGYYKFGPNLFWNSWLYLLAYPWSVGVLAYTILGLDTDNSNQIFSKAVYPLVLWPPVAIVMFELKNATRRSRPAKKDMDRPDSEHWIQRKKFPMTSQFLAKHNGDQSFPSGDVMMAVLMALPLWYLDGYQHLFVAITLLSALGRMYVLAHHLSDVIAGFLLTLGIHHAAIRLGYGLDLAKWWHPLLAIALYAIFHRVTKSGSNPTSKQEEKSKRE